MIRGRSFLPSKGLKEMVIKWRMGINLLIRERKGVSEGMGRYIVKIETSHFFFPLKDSKGQLGNVNKMVNGNKLENEGGERG